MVSGLQQAEGRALLYNILHDHGHSDTGVLDTLVAWESISYHLATVQTFGTCKEPPGKCELCSQKLQCIPQAQGAHMHASDVKGTVDQIAAPHTDQQQVACAICLPCNPIPAYKASGPQIPSQCSRHMGKFSPSCVPAVPLCNYGMPLIIPTVKEDKSASLPKPHMCCMQMASYSAT